MQVVEGRTLTEARADGDADLDRLLARFVSVCETVDFAHQQGVVHRDLNGAIDHLRRQRPVSPLERDHIERVGEMLEDQEQSYLRDTCWAEFKASLADAFALLQPRQRNVLRCHLKGLTAERIGLMYGVH